LFRPTETQLLTGIRNKVRTLSVQVQDKAFSESLDIIDLVLSELQKRQHHRFYVELYAKGRALAQQGLAYVKESAELGRLRAGYEATLEILDESMNGDLLNRHISNLSETIEQIVSEMDSEKDSAQIRLLDRIVEWEAELHAGQADEAMVVQGPAGIVVTCELLKQYMRFRFAELVDVEVLSLRRIPGGFAKATLEFDVLDKEHGRRALVIRADQPLTIFHMDGAVVSKEFHAVRFAFEAGIPVAEPLWLEESAAALGAPFFVSKKVAGTNFGDVMDVKKSLSEDIIKELMRVLAKIHATPLTMNDPSLAASHLHKWVNYETLTDLVPEYVKYWRAIAEKSDFGASPALTRGFNWLLKNAPVCPERPRLLHGDYGLHNVLLHDGQVSAVLDWEASYIGDPADEFFLFSQAVGSHYSQEQLMRWYWEAGGMPISEYRLRYFEVLNCLKGPITGYASMSLIGKQPSADLKFTAVSYRFVTRPMRSLNERIAAAEAAR
jgi:aminoglycoside phosphotransferase (APT) family kinase protein